MPRLRPRNHPIFIEDDFEHRKPRRVRIRYLLAFILALILIGWSYQRLNAAVYEQELPTNNDSSSSADYTSLDDVAAGQLLLKTDNNNFTTALIQNSKVDIKISGMVAHVSVQQTFHNQSQHWVEGVYAFPLPDKAAVNRMRMVIGERIIEGTIKEKSEAKKIYQQAKAAGKKASLVKQQRPNLFTTKIANIGPNESITVHLNYIESVAYDHGQFSLRFPMTITPRYIPGMTLEDNEEHSLISNSTGWALPTDQVADAHEITPWMYSGGFTHNRLPNDSNKRQSNYSPAGKLLNPISLTVELDMNMPLQSVDSAYHNTVMSRSKNNYSLRLKAGRVSMTQDFVLNWQPMIGNEPKAAIFSEQVDGEDYALLMMLPPQTNVNQLAKEVIYIIDTSGSMDGVSIRQARKSLLFALEQLTPEDRFNIIAFNSTTHLLFPQAVTANGENISRAQHYVSRLQSGGGTEMLSALNAALTTNGGDTEYETDNKYVRQVVFITDGAVGNEAALFKSIHQQLAASRLFMVGIGSAPNSHFMRKAAQFGRGSFTHIGNVGEVQQKMTTLFTKLNSPIATNIKVRWPNGQAVETYPNRIPDLYSGEPLLLAAKLKDLQGDIVVSGQTASKEWRKTIKATGPQQHEGIATLWAREKISDLLDAKTAGKDVDEVRDDVLSVALTHQLISPYTSFVAVEKTISRPAAEQASLKSIPNAQAKGQNSQHYAYPNTATGATESLLWGFLLLVMAVILKYCLQKEVQYDLVN